MLPGNLIDLIKRIGSKNNTKIYLVGGPLRDKLLGKKTKDLDFVVEKKIKDIGKDLAKYLHGKFQFYREFITGTIRLNDQHIDLAQTRKEIYPQPAILPKVMPSDLVSDLFRRDFTINAMAQDLTTSALIDPYNGLADLKKGVIQVLHDRSFIDDPTRIFRAIRFAERFDFAIEPNTLKWLRASIKQKLPALLSGERILNELRLIMQETKSIKMIERLNKETMFQSLFHKRLTRKFFNRFAKISKYSDSNLMLIYLLAQFNLPDKFPLNKEEMSAIRDWQRFPRVRKSLAKANRPSRIYQILRDCAVNALRIAQITESPKIARKVKNYLGKFMRVKIGVRGDDISKLGIKPGVIYGQLLDKILFARLDGKVKTLADELRLLKKMVKDRKAR